MLLISFILQVLFKYKYIATVPSMPSQPYPQTSQGVLDPSSWSSSEAVVRCMCLVDMGCHLTHHVSTRVYVCVCVCVCYSIPSHRAPTHWAGDCCVQGVVPGQLAGLAMFRKATCSDP